MPLFTLILATLLSTSEASPVRGTVRDLGGQPVAGAMVYIEGSQTQTTTDADGRFELPAPSDGPAVVVVYLAGFGSERREVATGDDAPELDIALQMSTDTLVVSVPPLPPAEASTVVTPLQVVRTPGTQADAFRMLRTFPGVVQADEGAGLFVRGGDTNEVLVLLDGTPIAHPYRHETPTGGYAGFVDPFLLSNVAFSTGGFPARFGNALSAVVELEGAGAPAGSQSTLTAGLAGAAMSLAVPNDEGWSVRAAGNLSFPQLLFSVNGDDGRFHEYPGGWDASLSLHRQTGRGPLKLFALAQADDVGVRFEGEGFAGSLDSGTRQRLVLARDEASFGDWRLTTSLGAGDYRSTVAVGVLAQRTEDEWTAGRVELSGTALGAEMHLGMDADWTRSTLRGQVPRRGGDLDGSGGVLPFAADRDDVHGGAFADASWPVGVLTAQVGARADHFADAGVWTVDPRLTLSVPLAGGTARAAWGLYHQAPGTAYFDTVRGARELPPLRAEHWIAGYERGEPARGLVRVEAYRKRYRDLPLEDVILGYSAAGYGRAEGVDLFAQRTFERGELRASYSYLHARRRWSPAQQRARFELPAGTWEPDFSIPHSLQVVASFQPVPRWSLGLSWRMASGRPFTPVLGAEAAGEGYLPVYGAINSERLPRYERLDLSASHPILVAGTPVLLFAGVSNALDRLNIFQYTYSADFSRRQPVKNAAPRTFYLGFSILDLWRKP
jgi:vitamin B12 transporter